MVLDYLFYIGIILVAGLVGSLLINKINLPSITGYLIMGILLGPSLLGVIPDSIISDFSWTSEVALSFIALTIGTSLKKSYFKRVGAQPIIIACAESFGAWIAVTVVMVLFGIDFRMAIICGAIASATAPAITFMVIKQFKAKGPLSETLLAVVAIDDAFALIAFGFSAAIVSAINAGEAGYQISLLSSILTPFWDILKSLLVGGGLGLIAYFGTKFIKNNGNRTILLAAIGLLGTGLAKLVGGSTLLTCMIIGATYINIGDEKLADEGMCCVDNIMPPLMTMFFVVAGAGLKLSLVPLIGLTGIIHLVMRMVGKWGGAWLGGKLTKSPKAVCNLLGPCLFPQAGVAIGLSLLCTPYLSPEQCDLVLTITLVGSLFYDTTGSILTKFCLQWAGEIGKGKDACPAVGATPGGEITLPMDDTPDQQPPTAPTASTPTPPSPDAPTPAAQQPPQDPPS